MYSELLYFEAINNKLVLDKNKHAPQELGQMLQKNATCRNTSIDPSQETPRMQTQHQFDEDKFPSI